MGEGCSIGTTAPGAMAATPAGAWGRVCATKYGCTAIKTIKSSTRLRRGDRKECHPGEQKFPNIRLGNWWPTSSRWALRRSRTRRWNPPMRWCRIQREKHRHPKRCSKGHASPRRGHPSTTARACSLRPGAVDLSRVWPGRERAIAAFVVYDHTVPGRELHHVGTDRVGGQKKARHA